LHIDIALDSFEIHQELRTNHITTYMIK